MNARDEFVYEVAEVRVFGSYLEPHQPLLGDVDLVVKLAPRGGLSHQEATKLSLARAAASGRQFSNYLQQLCFGRHEVLRQLKARNPHLSIHSPDDVEQIGAESRVVFRKQSTAAERGDR